MKEPWLGKEWKEAEARIDSDIIVYEVPENTFHKGYVYGLQKAWRLLKEGLKKDYSSKES